MKCVFCEFATKNKIKNKSYPFNILHESKNTISFLSLDFPKKEDGHILIIPKKHFKNLEDVSKEILHELIEHITLTAKVLRKTHKGCNVWLNDGKKAGQDIFHTHFHVVPRDKKDGIKIRIWKRKKLNKEKFIKLNNKLKKSFKKLS